MHETREEYKAFHERRHALLLALLERHVAAKAPRALDIGGGGDIGGMGDLIRARFAEELHGVDQGDDVERARARGILAKPCNVDREPLPYDDAFFDLVLFASVIEHLYNPHAVMREIRRVLKPGGLLLIEAPNAVALGRRLDALAGRNPLRQFHEYNLFADKAFIVHCAVFYTADEIARFLAPHFEILETRFGMHAPQVRPAKALLRTIAATLHPPLSDFWVIAARKKR